MNASQKRRAFFSAFLAAVAVAVVPDAEAKGRTGSRRVGGSGRSGKGGRYVGGRK